MHHLAFIFLVGTRHVTWGSEPYTQPMRCGRCGTVAPFARKKSMQFITFFFVPVIPISGVSHLVVCPTCKAKYRE
jgi:hypothetical protein